MRFEQFQYFETLLQEGSFNKAANKLHITQPTLTNNIKSMEKEFGCTLIHRTSQGLLLTEEGKKVLAFSKKVSSLYQNLLDDIHASSAASGGIFSIVASLFFTEIILEPFLSKFGTQFPKIQVRLMENETKTFPEKILNTTCTFAVVSRLLSDHDEKCNPGTICPDEQFFDARFSYIPLFQDMFGLCLSRNSTLYNEKEIYPITLVENNIPVTTFRLENYNISDCLVLSSNNIDFHIKAFTQSNAVCCLPYFVYKQYFSDENSIIWRPFSNHISIFYYLIHPTEHQLSPAEQIFLNELQNYLIEHNFR